MIYQRLINYAYAMSFCFVRHCVTYMRNFITLCTVQGFKRASYKKLEHLTDLHVDTLFCPICAGRTNHHHTDIYIALVTKEHRRIAKDTNKTIKYSERLSNAQIKRRPD